MTSVRAVATAQQVVPPVTSIRALAASVGTPSPVSLSGLVNALLAPVHFHEVITTPSGTALGGSVDITLKSDGSYTFQVKMHDSGFDPYDFRVRSVLTSPAGLILLLQTSGHTDGTGSDLLGDINRDFEHAETGQKAQIKDFWLDARLSSMAVSKSYEDAGALHTIEDIAKDLLGFLVADVTLGTGLALVVCLSADLANALDESFVGTGGLVGVLVAGGVVWLFGPSAVIGAVVAGVVAGAITDAMIKHRSMTEEEYRFAATVFLDTLPPREKFFVTNLSHDSGHKYTWPSIDGSILLNLGDDAFDDPMHHVENSYPMQGQLFIHELTHAWQFKAKSFIPGVICKRVFETSTYDRGPSDQPWDEKGLEQQATIVDKWFGQFAAGWTSIEDVAAKLASDPAIHDVWFPYIANHIRMGEN